MSKYSAGLSYFNTTLQAIGDPGRGCIEPELLFGWEKVSLQSPVRLMVSHEGGLLLANQGLCFSEFVEPQIVETLRVPLAHVKVIFQEPENSQEFPARDYRLIASLPHCFPSAIEFTSI